MMYKLTNHKLVAELKEPMMRNLGLLGQRDYATNSKSWLQGLRGLGLSVVI